MFMLQLQMEKMGHSGDRLSSDRPLADLQNFVAFGGPRLDGNCNAG